MVHLLLLFLNTSRANNNIDFGIGSLGLSLECQYTNQKDKDFFAVYYDSIFELRSKYNPFDEPEGFRTYRRRNGIVVGRQWQKGKHTFRMGLLYDKSNLYWKKDFGSGELLYIAKSSNPIQVYSTYSLDLSSILSSDLTLQIGMMTQSSLSVLSYTSEYIQPYEGYSAATIASFEEYGNQIREDFPKWRVYPVLQIQGNLDSLWNIVSFAKTELNYEDKPFDVPSKDPKDCTPESKDIFCEEVQWRGDSVMYVSTSTTLYQIRENNRLEQVGKFEVEGTGSLEEQPKITDIAMDAQGHLYGIAGMIIYQIHPKTGKMKFLTVVNEVMEGLTAMPNGDLVAAGNSIVVVDPRTGKKLTIVSEGKYSTIGDIQYFDGSLYWIGSKNGEPKLMKVSISGELESIGTLEIQDIEGLGVYNQELIGFTSTGSIFKLDPKTGQIISKEETEKYEEQEVEQDLDTIDMNDLKNDALKNGTDGIAIELIDEVNQLSVDVDITDKNDVIPDLVEKQESEILDDGVDQSEDTNDEADESKSNVIPSKVQPLQFTGAASNFNQLSTTE